MQSIRFYYIDYRRSDDSLCLRFWMQKCQRKECVWNRRSFTIKYIAAMIGMQYFLAETINTIKLVTVTQCKTNLCFLPIVPCSGDRSRISWLEPRLFDVIDIEYENTSTFFFVVAHKFTCNTKPKSIDGACLFFWCGESIDFAIRKTHVSNKKKSQAKNKREQKN